ncbi:MAG: 23S rRNA (pseudouridine(1915)-N(3))-methyltransferase RlmH [Thiomargarita sp.]|nr:23S rRNA (pseudouridine(1915)-N(3))-methyltransferase RlmH [Thiomargarita sp.]
MYIDFICVGQKMPVWVKTAFEDYAKRLPANYHFKLIEIPLRKRLKTANIIHLQQQESEKMLAAIKQDAYVIALDEHGKSWNSVQLSHHLKSWIQDYNRIALLVGGPEGLSTECLQKTQQHWSLSTLTFPHQMVRVIVAEQLYRAWSILNNHPYHRV